MSEKGHAKNVANFSLLHGFVAGYGAAYNPSNPTIQLAALTALLTNAQASIDAINAKRADYTVSVNAREILYEDLSALSTRIVNTVKASGASDQFIEDVKSFVRKIQGRRATPKAIDDPNTPEDESQQAHSASQMSYTNRAENLNALIALLKEESLYNPNENALQTATLDTYYNDLKDANDAVNTSFVEISNGRIARNTLLYNDENGLVERAQMVKAYVKAAFGTNSPQYDQIKGIEFKRYAE